MEKTTVELPTESLSLFAQPSVTEILGVPHVLLPENYKLESLQKLQEIEKPARIKRTVQAHDVRGFIAYLNDYKLEVSGIYASALDKPHLVARIDDHVKHTPSHGTHEVHFPCPHTHEWKQWSGKNKTPFGQVEFAEFIENNVKDVVSPEGASMLEMVLNFRDTGNAEFSSAVRLGDGRMQFKFIEKQDAGELVFPSEIQIAIPVFEGDPGRYPMTAKLRYRIKDQALTLWYDLQRPDLVLRTAYDDLIKKVTADTGVRLYLAV